MTKNMNSQRKLFNQFVLHLFLSYHIEPHTIFRYQSPKPLSYIVTKPPFTHAWCIVTSWQVHAPLHLRQDQKNVRNLNTSHIMKL